MSRARNMTVVFCLTLASTACVSAQHSENNQVSLARRGGEGLFTEKCGMCHRESGMGTGLLGRRIEGELAQLENREDLNADFISTVVRNGLGNMMPLSRGEVSDAQLETIATYLAGETE